ncbi:PilZ domain-containing protein [Terriglobus aquaticus]|uniref:PilZ domain-containing protein n=1 Tax=Terriglobus aquaticus TaxID=940139 RepID=A0ABW9KKS2_9BACT|nr:PilZ domain-containing protein [Terriglobus aquaticus]
MPAPPPAVNDPLRASVRFPLQLPVQLHAGEAVVAATTVDVSATGMLFTSEDVLEVGTELDWELLLPAEAMGTAADISVLCHGRVVWVQHEPPTRMAVMIDQYRMKENAP